MTEQAPSMTLLETAFPFESVAELVLADRRRPDPAYQAHRWWARRPPALLRSVLLAATLPPGEADELWRRYATPEPWLSGTQVSDPFMGGGTTLLEAARLGADVTGADIDAVATTIGAHQLKPPAAEDVESAGQRMLTDLRAWLGHLWPSRDPAYEPLHYFTLARVTCPACATDGHLYRSLVLARSTRAAGSVVRDAGQSVFCPHCLSVHDLPVAAKRLHCCRRYSPLDAATFHAARYHCPCGHAATLEELKAGAAPRTLVAVEDVDPRGRARRRLRAPTPGEDQSEAASRWLLAHHEDQPHNAPLTGSLKDNRPVSFGLSSYRDLFTARQWALLTAANRWLASNALAPPVERALRLAVSNAILANNRLCGYARDYGRLAPLFSVRAFALPALSVELNPLALHGGRGTLAASLRKVVASCSDQVTRAVRTGTGPMASLMTLPRSGHGAVHHRDSAPTQPRPTHRPPKQAKAALIVTDPPYFDFIEYSNLSQVFAPWLRSPSQPDAASLLPDGADGAAVFTARLSTAFAQAMADATADPLLAFTFKGSTRAWVAVAAAVAGARLAVSAAWPVLADPRMGHHAHAGNCEFDILVVARRAERAVAGTPVPDPEAWTTQLAGVREVSAADRAGFARAIAALRPCWAIGSGAQQTSQRQRTSPVTTLR